MVKILESGLQIIIMTCKMKAQLVINSLQSVRSHRD